MCVVIGNIALFRAGQELRPRYAVYWLNIALILSVLKYSQDDQRLIRLPDSKVDLIQIGINSVLDNVSGEFSADLYCSMEPANV